MKIQQIIPSTVQIPYALMPTAKAWQSSENEGLSILESGKNQMLIKQAVSMIEAAKEIICLQSFLLEKNAIIEAVLAAQKRGIKVFVLTSNSHIANKAYEEDESFAKPSYIDLLENAFKYHVMLRSHESFHAKYILIDPKTNPKGMLFTCNLTKTPLVENPELATKLSETQVKELFTVFVYHFWEVATHEQNSSKDFMAVIPIKKYQLTQLKDIFLTCHDAQHCSLKTALKTAIQHAKKEIVFSTFGFDITHEIGALLIQKMQSGVRVTVFTRIRSKSIDNQLSKLAAAGAEIYCQEKLHAKFLLTDSTNGLLFTANFEKHGLDEGMEVGIALNAQQVKDLSSIVKGWENNFPYKIETNIWLKNMKDKEYGSFENQAFTMKKVKGKTEIETILANTTLDKLQLRIQQKMNQDAKGSFSEKTIEWEWKLEKSGKKSMFVKKLGDGINLMKYETEIKSKEKDKKPQILIKQGIQIAEGVTIEGILAIKEKEIQNLPLYF